MAKEFTSSIPNNEGIDYADIEAKCAEIAHGRCVIVF
jgi:hypothetical protein